MLFKMDSDHFEMYTNIEPLCYVTGTNMML